MNIMQQLEILNNRLGLKTRRGITSNMSAGFWLGAGTVGGWKELGRTTLGTSGDTIDVTGLANKRYLMTLGYYIRTGAATVGINRTFNADSGANYAGRKSINGGSDTTTTSANNISEMAPDNEIEDFQVNYISNFSTKEKLLISHLGTHSSSGATAAPNRQEVVGKWANTTDAISSTLATNSGAGSYDTNSEVVVLGWNPADTHVDNTFVELDTDDQSTVSSLLLTGLNKKYVWIQAYFVGQTVVKFRLGDTSVDSGTNYARRSSSNGAADGTQTSITGIIADNTFDTLPHFVNMFIVNRSTKEKLVIGETVAQNTAGAGTAPQRQEWVAKWANSSAQFDRFEISSTANFTKVAATAWGFD